MMANLNYHSMLTPVSIVIDRRDGSNYNVQIRHNLIEDSDGIYGTTGIYSLFIDKFGLDKNDFEDLTEEDVCELPDAKNPDYLGRILFDDEGHWIYDGDSIRIFELEQIADYIINYEDSDV